MARDQPARAGAGARYRHQIRPVITVGAEAMDKIFANEQ